MRVPVIPLLVRLWINPQCLVFCVCCPLKSVKYCERDIGCRWIKLMLSLSYLSIDFLVVVVVVCVERSKLPVSVA